MSPYLRAHASNPVDWWPWGAEPFAEAARRDVPVMVSIGYATCHWCHVMARESFADPDVAAFLAERVVAVKVDREEHPDVDAAYLSAASAFTPNLGWPLTVFATPEGRVFYAGTYFPPQPVTGVPSFRQVVEAVTDAWRTRRAEVDDTATRLTAALTAAADTAARGAAAPLPAAAALDGAAAVLASGEDTEHGGFGRAPKFPVAPVLAFLAGRDADRDRALAERTLDAMAASPLRDAVEGGFFRYAVHRDWSEPHYERMLTDNAQLLAVAARLGRDDVATGIAGFLLDVLRLPGGGFASAQDSESEVDGVRVEGRYYALDAEQRAAQPRPALDDKVLTGWNGLAIGALARAGDLLGRRDWIDAAEAEAESLLAAHRRDGRLVRASRAGVVSSAPATLEDVGMLADGLLDLALATGDVRHAVTARALVDGVLGPDGALTAPDAPDPVLAAAGVPTGSDPGEGATPSGRTATATAAFRLHLLTGDRRYLDAARAAVAPVAALALETPLAFGAVLALLDALARPHRQLVVVGEPAGPLADLARPARASVVAVVTPEQARAWEAAGFELFTGRAGDADAGGDAQGGDAAYLCEDFVCRLPARTPEELAAQLG